SDSCFAGSSEDLQAVTRLGRDDNAQIHITGATRALPGWSPYIAEAHPTSLAEVAAGDIDYAMDDRLTGSGGDAPSPDRVLLPYRAGYEPPPGAGCRPLIDPTPVKEGAGRVMDVIRGWLQ